MMPCSNISAARMRRSSIAAKSRRDRTRYAVNLLAPCFTGILVMSQCRTDHYLTGSNLFRNPLYFEEVSTRRSSLRAITRAPAAADRRPESGLGLDGPAPFLVAA